MIVEARKKTDDSEELAEEKRLLESLSKPAQPTEQDGAQVGSGPYPGRDQEPGTTQEPGRDQMRTRCGPGRDQGPGAR